MILRTGSLAVVSFLLLATFIQHAQAARTPQQRSEQRNPYLLLPPDSGDGVSSEKLARSLGKREFRLRHIYHHGSHDYPHLHRYLDIHEHAPLQVTSDYGQTMEAAPETLQAESISTNIQRLRNRKHSAINSLLDHGQIHGVPADLPADAWGVDEVAGPNITDKKTVLTFAKMASNAYVLTPADGEWKDVKGGFNYTDDFGWEADGLRGHVFADETNSTIVIGLKGTSPAVFDGSDTTGNDKLNDNLFGSCCCAQGGQFMWKQVCDCMTSTYTCNNTCLVKSLRQKGHYYWSVLDLYRNVTERYPKSEVWLAGHSLGGVVSGLLGLTYGLPTLTYEAYPDALAASRLGLPTPPGYKIGSHQSRVSTGIYHVGHTADPIYMGVCNTVSSFCTIAGYAFEGQCHTGQTCVYDTVGDLGWRVGIGTHKISNVIRDVIEKYDTVPACETDVDCQDCFNWKFYESNGTETTTSSTKGTRTSTTTSSARTRTETCKTPGWWGCLDESTTSGPTKTTTITTTSTSTSSTSTCKTPGWFGCKDPITTTSTFTTTVSKPSAAPVPTITSVTSTCKTPGWLGCKDTSTSTSATPRPSSTLAFTTPTQSPSPSSTGYPNMERKKCASRHWYGSCKQWHLEPSKLKNDL